MVLSGVGAFPKAMEACGRSALDELLHERREAGRAHPRPVPGHQPLFRQLDELAAPEGRLLGALDASTRRAQGCDIGRNQVSWPKRLGSGC